MDVKPASGDEERTAAYGSFATITDGTMRYAVEDGVMGDEG